MTKSNKHQLAEFHDVKPSAITIVNKIYYVADSNDPHCVYCGHNVTKTPDHCERCNVKLN